MSWQDKAIALYNRFGAPAKFAAKMVLGAMVPGGPAVVQLVGEVLDCVHETTKDNWTLSDKHLPTATRADWQHVEEVLDVLASEWLAPLMKQLAKLDGLEEKAAETIRLALATDAHCRDALRRLDHLARRFDRLEEQNKKLLQGQGFAAGMLAEMLPLMRRMACVADYIDDLCAAGVSASDFRSCLHEFQDAARAFREGHIAEAATGFQKTASLQPQSAAAAAALAGVKAASHDFLAAEKSIARAASLRPGDTELAELHRRVTVASRGATPREQSTASETWRQAPKVGDTLDGWRLELLLGHGGWGRVFKASRGIETRALKVMHPDLSRDPLFVERFKKEILTLAGLRGHKNLVAIDNFGYAAEAGCWYFVMELIEGTSLEYFLQKHGPLSLPEARSVFLGLADGLAVAHDRGIIHRDIKPANVLLRRDGTPVLVDFGLAAVADDRGLTRTGQSAGYTAMFAAPEQLRGKPADARSDIYSLAASLYYALVYDNPENREPDQFDAKYVPEPLRELLTVGLDPKPERRLPDAATFHEAWRQIDEWLQQKKEEEERQRAEAERKRRQQEEAEKSHQELLRRYEEARRQAELERLGQEGERKLRSFMWTVLDQTKGTLTPEAAPALNDICTMHGVSAEQANQILVEVREQWERRQREETERLRQDGESKLAQFILQALERNEGKLGQEDLTAAKEVCQQYGLSAERVKQVIVDARKDWKQVQAEKQERERLQRLEEEEEEARLEVERQRWRTRQQGLLIAGSVGTFGIVIPLMIYIFSRPPSPEPPPRSTAKAPPVSERAVIVVKVDQAGAEVLVDGGKITRRVPRAKDPIEIDVEPGWHELRISKDNFEDDKREVKLRAGESRPITVQLKVNRSKVPEATLELVIDQPGAEVFIGRTRILVTVLRLSKYILSKLRPGRYKLRISKEGFEDYTRDIELKAGESLPITVQLKPKAAVAKRAVIVVEVDQVGADVLVNGKAKATILRANDPVEIPVDPGKHIVTVRKNGFEDFRKVVEVKEGNPPAMKLAGFNDTLIILKSSSKVEKGVTAWVEVDEQRVKTWSVGKDKIDFQLKDGTHHIIIYSIDRGQKIKVFDETIILRKYLDEHVRQKEIAFEPKILK